MMKLELRLALECQVCEQLVDSVPPGIRPKDALTGRVHLGACMMMGLCPVCFTELDWPYDWKKIVSRYIRLRKKT